MLTFNFKYPESNLKIIFLKYHMMIESLLVYHMELYDFRDNSRRVPMV